MLQVKLESGWQRTLRLLISMASNTQALIHHFPPFQGEMIKLFPKRDLLFQDPEPMLP